MPTVICRDSLPGTFRRALSGKGQVRKAALAMGAVLFSLAGWAQMNTGQIVGIVKDPSGDVIPKAAVTATEQATQRKFTAETSDTGQYLLPQLPVGTYTLTAIAQG